MLYPGLDGWEEAQQETGLRFLLAGPCMSPRVGKAQNLTLSSKDHGTPMSQVSMPTNPTNNIFNTLTLLCSGNLSNAESYSLLSLGIF